MSKIVVSVYRDDQKIFQQECDSYLLAAKGDEKSIKCSIIAQSEKNMRHLVTACMVSALGTLVEKGVTEEDIDEFFKRAIDEMFTADQVKYEQVSLNEPLH